MFVRSVESIYGSDQPKMRQVNAVGSAVITSRTEVNDASYGVLDTDYYIAVVNLSASRTITLPDGMDEGFTVIVKDVDGLCSTYPMSVVAEGTDTIDGSTVTMNKNYMSLTFVYDGVSNYEII